MKPAPVLSLVTGTRNRPDDFRRLVDSIEKHTTVKWQLVVSDASDTPIENEAVATDETWPKILIIPERPPLGYAAGFNRACRRALAKWILFLNDDCELSSGYDRIAIQFMEAHPQIGLGILPYSNRGGPLLVNEHWGMQYANFGILRRTLGAKIGYFDEEIPMYGSDNALTFKVLLAGFGVAPIHGVRILHHETQDQHRIENQHGRTEHADRLKTKYWPHLAEMRATYERTLVAA